MDMVTVRDKILRGFNFKNEYSHVLPFYKSGYIDGLFHISMLAGAAKISQDNELLNKATTWIRNLSLNPGHRDWDMVNGVVIQTQRKEQSFAGPCALQWAINNGVDINYVWDDIKLKAKVLTIISPIVLYGYNQITFLKQHINSCMLAHLLLKSKPICNSEILINNPFYKYICGQKCVVNYDTIRKPWGSAWLWKQIPIEHEGPEDLSFEYTPIASYVAAVLQSQL
jgi:hypothetical protein